MRRFVRSTLAACGLAGLLCAAVVSPARAAQSAIGGFVPGAGLVSVPVTSLRDLKFRYIVRQHYDYSCGAAAVATVLKYAYGIDASEAGVIRGMIDVSDAAVVRKRGFSMLDMKHYADSIGLAGAGYRISLGGLYAVSVPVIVLLDVQGYTHFVVLKKTTPAHVYVADPMLGNRVIPTSDFVSSWDGLIFVIASPAYDMQTPLRRRDAPLPFDDLARSVPQGALALGNAELMSVYIPAMTRL